MHITTHITLDATDSFDMTISECVDAIFQALGADEDVDFCTVTITGEIQTEEKGKPPGPPA